MGSPRDPYDQKRVACNTKGVKPVIAVRPLFWGTHVVIALTIAPFLFFFFFFFFHHGGLLEID